MNQEEAIVRFKEIQKEMLEVFIAKNSDYSGDVDAFSNFKNAEKQGINAWEGLLPRLGDKYDRLLTAGRKTRQGGEMAVKNESVTDTFTDMANYAIIGRMLYEEKHGKTNVAKTIKTPT